MRLLKPNNKSNIIYLILFLKKQLMACAISKFGYSTWIEVFFGLEGKREEYFNLKKQKKSVYRRDDELFRLKRIADVKHQKKSN